MGDPKDISIALVNLPSPFLTDDLVIPPLGIMYLSSYLKAKGFENIRMVDLASSRKVPSLDEDIIGISSTTPCFPEALRVLKKLGKYSKAHFVIGGPHATVSPMECRKKGFNQVVIGEGERAILKIVNGNRDSFIKEPLIPNLDSIPFPDRASFPMAKYSTSLEGRKATTMITSRGCPFSCSFCCKVWGKGIRFRSYRNVLEEAALLREMGYEGIAFYDDEFFLNAKRDIKIAYGLKKLGFIWRCITRADFLTRRNLKIMKECGCIGISLGIESGSNLILKNIRKGLTVEDDKRAIERCNELNIKVKGFFIVGLPGESTETLEATRKFIREVKLDEAQFAVYTPYPGSDIYDNPRSYDISFKKGLKTWFVGKKGEYATSIRTSSLNSEQILSFRDELEREFHGKK